MKLVPHTVLMVPGYTGSGPGHWQSLWERAYPEYRRVEQHDWDRPDRAEWIRTLDREIRREKRPVVLVGHSAGCVTIVQWAACHGAGPVAGALLVAPADVDAPEAPEAIRPLAPLPRVRLPFPSILVAGDDDPYLRPERARELARAWGSRLHRVPGARHFNTASGHGPWPEGERLLDTLRGRSR